MSGRVVGKLTAQFREADESARTLLQTVLNLLERQELLAQRKHLPGRLANLANLSKHLELQLEKKVERCLEQVRFALEEMEVIHRQLQSQDAGGEVVFKYGQAFWRKRQLAEAMLVTDKIEDFQVLLAEWQRE